MRPVPDTDLPLFYAEQPDHALFYAPGCLVVTSRAAAGRLARTLAGQGDGWAGELQRQAARAVARAARLATEPFRPECLTLYLTTGCTQQCVYCYADPAPGPGLHLAARGVAAAADQVAANCRDRGRPLNVVVHGGGEPTRDRARVDRFLALARRAADRHGLATFTYVATAGVMPERKAAWLARSFDLVGLSCDGPAEIHDRQRPGRDGRGTLASVERTAHILHQEGTPVHVRATITRAGLDRQPEIAAYICGTLRAAEIHVEPVYRGGRTGAATQLQAQDAPSFVAGFLAARAVAAGQGVPLNLSGSRPERVHGAYCHVFRQVLNLVPGREVAATACFKDATADQAERRGTAIATLDPATGQMAVDPARLAALRGRLAAVPPGCADCFNRYHCTRGCPDACPLDQEGDDGAPAPAAFRCQAHRSLAAALLAERAAGLWREVAAGQASDPHGCLLS